MTAPQSTLPTTVLSGFLGAGKTTLLKRILENSSGLRVAVIVNDMSEINIDAQLVREGWAFTQAQAKLVEMTNGCICCTLRDDLLIEVRRLAEEGRFDYLVIESTGISEPMPVAASFSFRDPETKRSLADLAHIDCMVTVVDGQRFSAYALDDSALHLVDPTVPADDIRSLCGLLTEQVEFADVLVLNKVDQLSEDQRNRIVKVLKCLNPDARILLAEHCCLELNQVLATGLFDEARAAKMAGWYQELEGRFHLPETEEFGIASYVYRARRPFHPARLSAALSGDIPGLLRSKGYAWLATRPGAVMWSSAGSRFGLTPSGPWWAELPAQRWPAANTSERQWIEQRWQTPYGDRRQEIVFIGQDLSPEAIDALLQPCLLTDQEMLAGPPAWADFPDPLPSFVRPLQPA